MFPKCANKQTNKQEYRLYFCFSIFLDDVSFWKSFNAHPINFDTPITRIYFYFSLLFTNFEFIYLSFFSLFPVWHQLFIVAVVFITIIIIIMLNYFRNIKCGIWNGINLKKRHTTCTTWQCTHFSTIFDQRLSSRFTFTNVSLLCRKFCWHYQKSICSSSCR